MNLASKKLEILKLLQSNRSDIIKYEQELEGLHKGVVFLQGQLALIDELIKSQELEKGSKNEDLSSNLQQTAISSNSTTS